MTVDVDFDTLSIREIVDLAVQRWEVLTGVDFDSKQYSSLYDSNGQMRTALELDEDGITTYLLFECFLREYLSQRTFTAAEIMKNYGKAMGWFEKAEELFKIVQSDRAVSIINEFRNRVLQGVKHYKADSEEVLGYIHDPDALPFLRRDALMSMSRLHAHQFMKGTHSEAVPQVIEHVYLAWNVNDLILGMRDLSVSGIAMVVIRDPAYADRSWFGFVLKNGDNIILLSDKKNPAFPGQENVLQSRGRSGRRFDARKWNNHFPYHLIKHSYDEEGEIVMDAESAPVLAGSKLVPLMRIRDLQPDEIVWTTMMLSLISDRYWKQKVVLPQLSYTGEMVRKKDLLLTNEAGLPVPVGAPYETISLEDITLEDLSTEAVKDAFDYKPTGSNDWLIERYRHRISVDILNTWQPKGDQVLILTHDTGDNRNRQSRAREKTPLGAIVALPPKKNRSFFDETPSGSELLTFSPGDYGTEETLKKNRIYIARSNLVAQLNRFLAEEHDARKASVMEWYRKALEANTSELVSMAARQYYLHKTNPNYFRDIQGDPLLASVWEKGDPKHHDRRVFPDLTLGPANYSAKKLCLLTERSATIYASFTPKNAVGLCQATGLDLEDIPDVLHHWHYGKDYTGNHLLNSIDPMDHAIRNPWNDMKMKFEFHLSKSSLNELLKAQGLKLPKEAATS